MISRFWTLIIGLGVGPLIYIRKYRVNRVGQHSRFRFLYVEFEFLWNIQVEVSDTQWVLLVSVSERNLEVTAEAIRVKSLSKGKIFIHMVLELLGIREKSGPHFLDPELHGIWESEQPSCEDSVREVDQGQLRQKRKIR